MIRKFFQYLGFNDTSINAEQLLNLICLLGKENISIIPQENILDMVESVLSIYINAFETNGFRNITEYEIIEKLK